jgi:hypothetical protein
MIKGEIGLKIKQIRLREYQGEYDIVFEDKDGGFFIVCGDNDAKTLFKDALDKIEYYEETLKKVMKK